jgi:hypothetical protein
MYEHGTPRARRPFGRRVLVGFIGAITATLLIVGSAAAHGKSITFDMVRSAAAAGANCLPSAKAKVTIHSIGPVEIMDVNAEGLPPKTEFDFFVIQQPNAPFGLSWYQGDVETNGAGKAHQQFIGRFSIETFAVAPGSVPAPVVHTDGPFPDAASNPVFGPIHTFHLGLWFNSPKDAQAAGCGGAVTPFNGDHNAGVQVLSTRNFANDQGPLRQLTP